MTVHPGSVLFVTLDSCRYDTFAAADVPHLRALGQLHRAQAPGMFTYSSHAAMFVGFTPGVATRDEPYVNPKHARLFMLAGGGRTPPQAPFSSLEGRDVVGGFRRLGYLTVGTAAMKWFDPAAAVSRTLTRSFRHFLYVGDDGGLRRQIAFVSGHLPAGRPVFAFVNVGETHQPYWHEGAAWERSPNPCRPDSRPEEAAVCRDRQRACLEYVDRTLAPLLDRFAAATVVVCGDHGDAWGEDGLWGHGFHHPKVAEVPLVVKLGAVPRPTSRYRAQRARVTGRIRRASNRLRWSSPTSRPGSGPQSPSSR